uniref:(northern house mosquito) hypothetical protein n=1 Tax=Culex pipiens TaxID=7175 RepID=A0A8D8BBT8_CULPI
MWSRKLTASTTPPITKNSCTVYVLPAMAIGNHQLSNCCSNCSGFLSGIRIIGIDAWQSRIASMVSTRAPSRKSRSWRDRALREPSFFRFWDNENDRMIRVSLNVSCLTSKIVLMITRDRMPRATQLKTSSIESDGRSNFSSETQFRICAVEFSWYRFHTRLSEHLFIRPVRSPRSSVAIVSH